MKAPIMSAENSLLRSGKNYVYETFNQGRTFDFDVVPQAEERLLSASTTGGEDRVAEKVFARGNIRAEFPSLSVEKEFYQALNSDELNPHPGSATLFSVLCKMENLYLTREMCWVFQVNGIDVYVLAAASEQELSGFVRGLATHPSFDFDVIVGAQVGQSNPAACNGIGLPLVYCKGVNTYTYKEMAKAIVDRAGVPADRASAILSHFLELTNNDGQGDDNRAINFLTLRYMGIYTLAYQMEQSTDQSNTSGPVDVAGFSLASVATRPSTVRGGRNIYDVIFNFTGNSTGVLQQWFCRVDITGQHPFLLNDLVRYYAKPS